MVNTTLSNTVPRQFSTNYMILIPNKNIPIKIIFEDGDIIALNKPAGLPVYPLKGEETETLANGLVAKWPELASLGQDAGLVHRLDNDTSGIMLVAKNESAYKNLRKEFENREVYKEYTALVLGETPSDGIIDSPIVHDGKKMKIIPLSPKERGRSQQKAHTEYKVIKKFLGGQYSLLKVIIKTGVRHQIRVHLASIGHPIAGDTLYCKSKHKLTDRTELNRQFLHASKIRFNHPSSGKLLESESPLPRELENVLTKLEAI